MFMKKEKTIKIKFTAKEQKIANVLVEELINWKSTTKATVEEMLRLIKRLAKLK